MTKPEDKEIIVYVLISVTRAVLSLVQSDLSKMNFPTLKDLHQEKENLQIDFAFVRQKTKAIVCSFTCALLGAARTLAMHSQLASKVFLPEFSKPHIPPVVRQAATFKIPIKSCEKVRGMMEQMKNLSMLY